MDTLSALPSVHQVLEQAGAQALVKIHGRGLVLFAVKRALDEERTRGAIAEPAARLARIDSLVGELRRPRLRPVINATGVVLHTNLGRAPMAVAASQATAAIAGRYSTLEFDPGSGRRGRRHDLVADSLRYLSGAEAAAVLLMLTALAKGKEVIVGRGELVEIGGGFRMPDVMRLSGARLVEVGTTNRTRPEDYAAAVTPKTVAILKVHASNFQVVGFTESVEIEALARVARQHRVLLLHDLGSGSLLDTSAYGLAAEPRIQDSLRAGTDLLACSGDKLLGGPQAGLLLGRTEVVDKVMKHPLARAVRIDKLTLAALTATLDLYLTQSVDELPIWNMLGASAQAIGERANRWQGRLLERGITVEVIPAESTVGGGSLPGERLATSALAITPHPGRAADLLRRLREHEPPVIGRIEQDRVLLDPRTVLPDEDDALLDAVVAVLA